MPSGISRPLLQDRLADHGGPVHLEQEGQAAPDVPHDIDLAERRGRRPDHERQVDATLVLREALDERPAIDNAVVLASGDPGAKSEPMAVLDERGDDPSVVGGAAREIVLGRERSALTGSLVCGQAGAHQLLVGCLESGKEPIDAIEEAVLVDASRGREDRPGGPLHTVGKRPLGQLGLAQPPQRPRLVADADERSGDRRATAPRG